MRTLLLDICIHFAAYSVVARQVYCTLVVCNGHSNAHLHDSGFLAHRLADAAAVSKLRVVKEQLLDQCDALLHQLVRTNIML